MRQAMLGILLASGVASCAKAASPSPHPAARPPHAVVTAVVECRTRYERECLYFYDNIWKAYRQEALKRKFISGYQLLRAEPEPDSTAADTAATFTLLQVTEYPDSMSLANVEANFQPIMRALRPNGPERLNGMARSDFVVSTTVYHTRPLASGR